MPTQTSSDSSMVVVDIGTTALPWFRETTYLLDGSGRTTATIGPTQTLYSDSALVIVNIGDTSGLYEATYALDEAGRTTATRTGGANFWTETLTGPVQFVAATTSSTSTSSTSATPSVKSSSKQLSPSILVGIGAGGGSVALLVLLGTIYLFVRRSRRRQAQKAGSRTPPTYNNSDQDLRSKAYYKEQEDEKHQDKLHHGYLSKIMRKEINESSTDTSESTSEGFGQSGDHVKSSQPRSVRSERPLRLPESTESPRSTPKPADVIREHRVSDPRSTSSTQLKTKKLPEPAKIAMTEFPGPASKGARINSEATNTVSAKFQTSSSSPTTTSAKNSPTVWPTSPSIDPSSNSPLLPPSILKRPRTDTPLLPVKIMKKQPSDPAPPPNAPPAQAQGWLGSVYQNLWSSGGKECSSTYIPRFADDNKDKDKGGVNTTATQAKKGVTFGTDEIREFGGTDWGSEIGSSYVEGGGYGDVI